MAEGHKWTPEHEANWKASMREKYGPTWGQKAEAKKAGKKKGKSATEEKRAKWRKDSQDRRDAKKALKSAAAESGSPTNGQEFPLAAIPDKLNGTKRNGAAVRPYNKRQPTALPPETLEYERLQVAKVHLAIMHKILVG